MNHAVRHNILEETEEKCITWSTTCRHRYIHSIYSSFDPPAARKSWGEIASVTESEKCRVNIYIPTYASCKKNYFFLHITVRTLTVRNSQRGNIGMGWARYLGRYLATYLSYRCSTAHAVANYDGVSRHVAASWSRMHSVSCRERLSGEVLPSLCVE